MKKWDLLSLNDFKEWSGLVNDCDNSDIHFTPEYLKAFENKMNGKANLFVFHDNENKNLVLYPFFKRKINDIKIFSSFNKMIYDIISPWYFGGPLLSTTKNQKAVLIAFVKDFKEFAKQNSIVTEFTRVHPLLGSSKDFVEISNAECRYDVTFVDLEQSENIIWKNFKKSNRNAINSGKRKGVEVEFSNSYESLKIFHELYLKTMNRLKVDEFYYFTLEFLEEIRQNLKNNFIIAISKIDGMPLSSSIFLYKSGMVHYWLSAQNEDIKGLFPTNVLIYETIKWAKTQNQKIFFLMGGSNKSLRMFKESFSKSKVEFFILRKVYNQKKYDYLTKIRDEREKTVRHDFFPAYRV